MTTTEDNDHRGKNYDEIALQVSVTTACWGTKQAVSAQPGHLMTTVRLVLSENRPSHSGRSSYEGTPTVWTKP